MDVCPARSGSHPSSAACPGSPHGRVSCEIGVPPQLSHLPRVPTWTCVLQDRGPAPAQPPAQGPHMDVCPARSGLTPAQPPAQGPHMDIGPARSRSRPSSAACPKFPGALVCASECVSLSCSLQHSLCEFAGAAIYQVPPTGLTQWTFTVPRAWKPRRGQGRGLPGPLSLCVDGRPPPVSSRGRPSVRVCVLIPLLTRTPVTRDQGPPRWPRVTLITSVKTPLSRYGHVLRC